MTSPTSLYIIVGSLLVPSCAVLGMAHVLRWRREKRQRLARAPISEKLLRPAGESLRLRIDDLAEQFGERLSFAMILPGAMLAAVLLMSPDSSISRSRAVAAFVICTILLLILLRRAFQNHEELSNCRLGFHGERAVAEELNQLMAEGCRVFHDLPMEPYGNIDHVIVSTAGVFAVETKMRRKRPPPQGKRDCDAVFDGEAVHFPTWTETRMVDQARMQAERLSTFLTSAVGAAVAVQAVLTLPGWFLTSRVPPGKVRVLNPKGIRSIAVDARALKLSAEMIQRICHQLEAKCRTVEL
ncbi:nuclease-related domain-containing protein [Prosthecobacter fluviatilis]|uniref:Nuclease-related domain-containing protein n=1 Tax=Prosthecobacter fluviatilis TaxID=445931 RepID=A0ABW0KTP7_9BACT